MPCTFSYKTAAKLNHKMASKYAAYENDTEDFTISNGWEKNWVRLNKMELMEIPWMKEAIEGTDAKLFINDCLGFDIKEITDAGAIHLASTWWSDNHLRILKNTKKPSRFLLKEYYRVKDGEWELDPNYPREIRCASVSANFGTLPDGFRVFTDGEKKYYYKKNGKRARFVCPMDDDCFGYCCADY